MLCNASQLSIREDCGKVHSWLQWLIAGLYNYMEMNTLRLPFLEGILILANFSEFRFFAKMKLHQ